MATRKKQQSIHIIAWWGAILTVLLCAAIAVGDQQREANTARRHRVKPFMNSSSVVAFRISGAGALLIDLGESSQPQLQGSVSQSNQPQPGAPTIGLTPEARRIVATERGRRK